MASDASLDGILKLLGKKATFEKGLRSLTALVKAEEPASSARMDEVLSAVFRAATLLRTRYSARGLWVAGLDLFQAALPWAAGNKEAEARLKGHVAAAHDILGEQHHGEGSDGHQESLRRPVPYHFEGQLSANSYPPPRAAPPLFQAEPVLLSALMQAAAAAGGPPGSLPRLDELFLREDPVPLTEAEASSAGAARQDEGEEPEGGGASPPRPQPGAGEGPSVAAVLEDLLSTMAPDGFHGLHEAIEASMQGGAQQVGAPPASKKEVKKMPTFEVTDDEQLATSSAAGPGATSGASSADLSEEGGEKKFCAVCQELWRKGDWVREMPCWHRFHVDCLQPWLDQRNSCPVCRHEVRTDDVHYELQKERDKEEAEERAGAANAVEEGAYMYL